MLKHDSLSFLFELLDFLVSAYDDSEKMSKFKEKLPNLKENLNFLINESDDFIDSTNFDKLLSRILDKFMKAVDRAGHENNTWRREEIISLIAALRGCNTSNSLIDKSKK